MATHRQQQHLAPDGLFLRAIYQLIERFIASIESAGGQIFEKRKVEESKSTGLLLDD